ncbi:MAG: hypothetical protein ACXWDN_14640 [Limisphaerales bacterium]
MKRRQPGYNLETTGMLPNFGKPSAPTATSETTSVTLASTVLDPVSSWLKKFAAAAKRVLLKPEEPQPFGASAEKKSYQIFRQLPAQDAVRHVATAASGEPTAEVFTDNQQLGKSIEPTLLEKVTKPFRREVAHSTELASGQPSATDAHQHSQQRATFGATCPGKPEANPIADAYEKRMAEKKAITPVAVKPATPVLHSAAKPEVKQSVPSKLRAAIFGRKRNAAQPAVQGEFALDNVRPIRNELLDADLEVVSAEAKVGTGILQTATVEKAITTTATSRRGITKKTDSAINSAADAPQAEPTPELIARV